MRTWQARVVGADEGRDQRLGRARSEQDRGQRRGEVEQDLGRRAAPLRRRRRQRVSCRQHRRPRRGASCTTASGRRQAGRTAASATDARGARRDAARQLALVRRSALGISVIGAPQARGRQLRIREGAATRAGGAPTGQAADIRSGVRPLRSQLHGAGRCVGREHWHHRAAHSSRLPGGPPRGRGAGGSASRRGSRHRPGPRGQGGRCPGCRGGKPRSHRAPAQGPVQLRQR